jgi:hypothetical protein
MLAVLLISLATMSSSALAGESKRQTLCHKPGTSSELTIEVLIADVADHLAHGDSTGPCPPAQGTVEYTCGASSLAFTTLYVRSGAAAGSMNGTVERPFGSVSAALTFARRKALPAVELQVAPGIYGPDIATITRPTRIVGAGRDAPSSAEMRLSIANAGPFDVGIQGVVFRANQSQPAISIASPAGHTEICDVEFDGVVGNAVSQTGGSFAADDVVIRATDRDPLADAQNDVTGTAMVLAGGVSASLRTLHLTGSAGSGLYATGRGTVVELDWEGLTTSRIDHGTGCLGAVHVDSGAALRSRDTTVDHNRMRGVHIDGAETSAEFDAVKVRDTAYLDGGEEASRLACGYNAVANMVITGGPKVTVTGSLFNRFVVSDADVVGLLIVGPAVPDVAFSWGVIRNNPIGVSVNSFNELPDINAWLGPFVYFSSNDMNLDTDVLPPPQAIVEWVCDNGIDDDGDGLTDFDDPNCENAPGAP